MGTPAGRGRQDAAVRAETVLHPIRIRIILALQGRRLTTRQVGRLLPDVPQATLYRHTHRLIEAGVISVVEETRTHGTVERTLALVREATQFTPGDFATLTPDALTELFSVLVGGLLDVFSRYAHSPARNLDRDSPVFYGEIVQLTDEEAALVRQQMRALVQRCAANPALAGRKRRMLAVFSIPDATEMGSDGS